MRDNLGGLDRVAANERRFLDLVKSRRADWATEFECECTGAVCDALVRLTAADYQPLRSSASWYAISPDDDHVDVKLDRVTERHAGYWVVERRPSLEVLDVVGSRTGTASVEVIATGDDTDSTA
jgi:hypothetical protein